MYPDARLTSARVGLPSSECEECSYLSFAINTKGVVQFRTFKDPFSATRDFSPHNLSYFVTYLVLGVFVGPKDDENFEYTKTILSLYLFSGCSSDVVDENAVPMTNFSAVRDMAVPSPGLLNIPSQGMPEMIQGGEMVAAATADEMMPDAPGGMPAGGTDDAPEGGSLPTGGGGGVGECGTPNAGGGGAKYHCPGVHGPVCLYLGLDSLLCADRCRDLAGDDVSDVYDAVFSCGRMNGCNDPGGRWNAQCMADSCRVPLRCRRAEFAVSAPPVGTPAEQEVAVHWASAISVSRNDEIAPMDVMSPSRWHNSGKPQERITNAVCE